MNKVLYICNHDLTLSRALGVRKKIYGQIKGFQQNQYQVDIITLRKDRVFIGETELYQTGHLQNKFTKQFKNARFFDQLRKLDFSLYHFIYLRYTLLTTGVFRFLKEVSSKVDIIIEYPNFPYDGNFKTLHDRILLKIDQYFRRKITPYVKGSINYTGFDTILNRPSLYLTNGIDLENENVTEPLEDSPKRVDDQLNLIAVANLSFWHGYDRIIKGLLDYSKASEEVKVHFHIVGDSKECRKLIKLVNRLELNDYVTFHGYLIGDQLYSLYNISHVGIGAVAVHRVQLEKTSALKLKEYSLQGIPIVAQETEDDFEGQPFFHKVSMDDSPISIRGIVEFVCNQKSSPVEIRNFALREFGWNKRMLKVINFVNKLEA